MTRQDLAHALGISASMVSRLAGRGMPTDSVERAARWRRKHLEPGRVKGMRVDTIRTSGTIAPRSSALEIARDDPRLQVAESLALAALATLQALDALPPAASIQTLQLLRLAMREVPPPLRAHVQIPLEVWDELTAQVVPLDADLPDLPDEQIGTFWYNAAVAETGASVHDVVSRTLR